MPGQNDSRPIVIKRRKIVAGDGHHGGAWKVAYADFVTAMMAFFLMLWLLGSTTDDQRKGLADHFSPTFPVHRVSAGGEGLYGGDEINAGDLLSNVVDRIQGEDPLEEGMAGEPQNASELTLEEVETILRETLAAETDHPDAMQHMALRMTDAGLQIELFDLDDSPLFDPGTDTATPVTQMLARVLGNVLGVVSNPITLDGHVRAHAIVEREDHAWPLSVSRPRAIHRMLEDAGIEPLRFRRLTGHGDRVPVTGNPIAPRNNRIELLLLRTDRPGRRN